MSDQFTIAHTGRLLNIDWSAGPDSLIMTRFSGTEQISVPFSFRLDVVSAEEAITPEQILGTDIGWSVGDPDGNRRPFSGVVARLGEGASFGRGYRNYYLDIVPSFWLLTHTANCQIFQNQTVPDIIQAVLSRHPDLDFDLSGLSGQYQPRDYCVQYRESDFAFVSRLMEDEGIFYFFQHSTDTHVMVLGDSSSAWFDAPGTTVSYGVQQDVEASVSRWQRRSRFRGGRWTQRDYNFQTPGNSLNTTVATHLPPAPFQEYEYYDYPGGYMDSGTGEARSLLRIQAEEAAYQEIEADSNVARFASGGRFDMDDYAYASDSDGSGWAVLALSHHASDYSHVTAEGTGQSPSYSNGFVCIGENVPYRPPRVTPRPVIMGLQVGTVVGPQGEEISTDAYGRIKVDFPWSRDGKSSCWMRVAQLFAGPQWGSQFVPRIGMEVVVSFLEGDPDRPLVIGCVYNARNMPPYALPANKTQSGIKTHSSIGGGSDNYNELRFEDLKGQEQVVFQAEKDLHGLIKNDETRMVGNDQTNTIHNNRTETIEQGDETLTIKQGKRTVTLNQGDDSLTLQQGNLSVTAQAGKMVFTAEESIEFKVGGTSIKLDQTSITLQSLMIDIEGEISATLSAAATTVNGDGEVDITGAMITIG